MDPNKGRSHRFYTLKKFHQFAEKPCYTGGFFVYYQECCLLKGRLCTFDPWLGQDSVDVRGCDTPGRFATGA